MKKLKIAFDIGGVLTRHETLENFLKICDDSPYLDVYILTDMDKFTAELALCRNGLGEFINRLLCAEWKLYGEQCKAVLAKEKEIDILIDDHLPYLYSKDFVGLMVAPRPDLPYSRKNWQL